MKRLALLVPVVVLVAACSDDEKTAEEIAVEANSELLCERLFDCCTPQELDALPFIAEERPPTKEGCIAYHNKTGREYLPLTEDEAKAGNVVLHTDASEQCIADLREESCERFSRRLLEFRLADAFALCNATIVEPQRAPGQECGAYLACKDGFCDQGRCRALPKVGDPCAPDPGCVKGSRCNPNALRCERYVDNGGACEDDGACTSGVCFEGRCASPGRCGG